jgi:hypothetical protein
MGVQDYPLSFYPRMLSQPKRQDYRSHNAALEGSSPSLTTKIKNLALREDAQWLVRDFCAPRSAEPISGAE